MIKILNKILISGAMVGLAGYAGFAFAVDQAEPLLTDKQEEALRNYAASMAVEPPQVVMRVTLVPPNTDYVARFIEGAEEIENGRAGEIFGSQKDMFGPGGISIAKSFNYADEWKQELSCGKWGKSNDFGGMRWSHPNTDGPDGCPHEDGVAHEGTVTLKGSYAYFLKTRDAKGADVNLLEAKYSFTCTHQGSEPAVVECNEQLVSWSGRYGSAIPQPANQESEKESGSRLGNIVLNISIAVGILVFGWLLWFFFRRRNNLGK